MVWYPIPAFPPVTMMTLPDKSGMSREGSYVFELPEPMVLVYRQVESKLDVRDGLRECLVRQASLTPF